MDFDKLRAWWSAKQGLDGTLRGSSPAEALSRAGWARSVGGANPYISIFARTGASRAEMDAALAAMSIHELPSARGCTYVLPATDFALGLTVGQGFADAAALNTATRFLGVTEAEVDVLGEAIVEALKSGDKDPRELRDLLGDKVRSLGEAGKKRGLTTTLPIALGLLQSAGRIRRVPLDGRLDQQRYRYAAWNGSPIAGPAQSQADAFTELARRYFRWIGPAKASHFQWFSGLGVKATKDAIAPLGLVDVEDGWLILPDEQDAFAAFEPPAEPSYSLVAGLDSIILLRRDLASLVEASTRTSGEQRAGASLGTDLENNAILDRGRLIGLWDYDGESNELVWSLLEPEDSSLQNVIDATESFIRDQLGDARAMSLDSPVSRRGRLQSLREMAAAAPAGTK